MLQYHQFQRKGQAIKKPIKAIQLDQKNILQFTNQRALSSARRPRHVYFSVLNWLFPERVGKKYKARCCVPLNGEYVVDVDSYPMAFRHKHKVEDHWFVCEQCLDMSKRLTLHLSEAIRKYCSNLAVVFSGC